MNRRSPQTDRKPAAVVALATLRRRSELRCERVIRLAHAACSTRELRVARRYNRALQWRT